MTGISSAETPAHVLSDSQLGAVPYVVPLALVLWGPQVPFHPILLVAERKTSSQKG